MTALTVIMLGFFFGIGCVVANALLLLIDRLLAMLILKSQLKPIIKSKDKPKPPEGLNFGSKLK